MERWRTKDVSKCDFSVIQSCQVIQKFYATFSREENLFEEKIWRKIFFTFTSFKSFVRDGTFTIQQVISVTGAKFRFELLFLTHTTLQTFNGNDDSDHEDKNPKHVDCLINLVSHEKNSPQIWHASWQVSIATFQKLSETRAEFGDAWKMTSAHQSERSISSRDQN